MAFEAGTIIGHLRLKKDQWNKAINDVKADQKSLGGLVLRNSQQFKKMGRAMTIAGGAIVGAFGLMVKAHARFDQSMTESLAIMGDVSDEMRKDMADAALEMSTKTTFSAEKLGEAYFFLASAGMDAAQSIKALPVVAKFAQAGTFNLALATDLLTDAQTALGLSSENAIENQENLIRVSDVLVGANTLANASVKQFAESLTNKAAAALRSVNKEMEEGVAILTAFADRGIKGQLAGQRLTMMMNGLFDATRRNKKEWAAIEISLWNAEEQMRDFADILGDLEVHLGEMTPEMREAELATLGFNLRTVDSIKTLLGSSGQIRENTQRLKEMGGITEEVAENQLKSLINQLTILKNTVTKAAISVGEILGPALKDTIESLKETIGKVAEWIKEHPKLTEIIAKSTLAVGALLAVLGPLMIMLPGIITAGPLVGAAFTAMLGPVGLVTLAITGLAGVVLILANNLKEAKKAMSDFATEAEVFGDAAENFKKLWIVVRKEGGETLEQFNELMKRFGGNWEKIMKQIIIDPKFAILKALLLDIASGVKTISLEGENLSITLPENVGKAIEGILPPAGKLVNSLTKLLANTKLQAKAYQQQLPIAKNMVKIMEDYDFATGKLGITTTNLNKIKKKATEDEIGMIESIGIAAIVSLGNSKLGAIAQATMSTYAGAAKSLELLGMPLAIPFIALSILTGLKQVQAIMAVNIPSAEEGAFVPSPTLVEAGHGPLGEVILPLDKAPQFMADRGVSPAGGARIDMNFYGPLISTTGLARADLERVSNDIFDIMEEQARRRGYRLNA